MTKPMSDSSMTFRVENERNLILEQVFDAPRTLVYSCFSTAHHLKEWWGPRGWVTSACTVDFRPHGKWHYAMKCVDEAQGDFFGMESWGLGIYHNIEEPERIEYTDYFSDEAGTPSSELPETKIRMIFEEQEGVTKVISQSEFQSADDLQMLLDSGMLQGIRETWEKLAEYVVKLHAEKP